MQLKKLLRWLGFGPTSDEERAVAELANVRRDLTLRIENEPKSLRAMVHEMMIEVGTDNGHDRHDRQF